MSIIKGILIYTAIFLGLVIGVGVILIGIMYFFPSVSVFGYKFYHGNNNGIIYEVVADDNTGVGVDNLIKLDGEILNNIDAVEIDADRWNINVNLYEAPSNNVTFLRTEFTRSITGFIKASSPSPTFSVKAEKRALTGEDVEKNVVTIKAVEPEGAYFNRSACLTVWIPNTLPSGEIEDLRIVSGNGTVIFSQVSVAELVPVGNPEINVKNFTLVDGSNDAKVKYVNILDTLNINATNSNFSIDRDFDCDVNLDCEKGKYKFGNILGETNNVNINAVNADVQFGNIEGNVTLKSDYGYFRANTINGNFSSLSHNVDDINNACDLKIQKILGSTIIQNDSGNIDIGQVGQVAKTTTTNDLRIDTHSGDVNIANCFAKNIIVTSTSGVIRLDKCLGSLDVSTQNGSVYVQFMKASDTVEGATDSEITTAVNNLNDKPIKISTGVDKGNGAIEVKNSRGQLTLESHGRGKIDVVVDNIAVNKTNDINAHNGNVNVVLPDEGRYWLNWSGLSSTKIHIVDFETSEKKPNSEMDNYSDVYKSVFMGGTLDSNNTTRFNIIANKNLTIYSKIHADLN